MHCVLKLWMIGFQHVPHSNQDTQVSIEFYHGTLKCWFSLKTKGLKGCQIDCLVSRLTTTIAWHYMHTSEMKKRGFIFFKWWSVLCKQMWIKRHWSHSPNVTQPSFVSDGFWIASNRHRANVAYKVKYMFTSESMLKYTKKLVLPSKKT